MSDSLHTLPGGAVRALRVEAGSHLRSLRTDAGMGMRDFAARLGYDRPNLISMIELGEMSLPMDKWTVAADALGVDRKTFCLRMLAMTQPEIHAALAA